VKRSPRRPLRDFVSEEAIVGGRVRVDGRVVVNPRSMILPGQAVVIDDDEPLRGLVKLRSALAHFSVAVEGRIALDVGAAAGGFTSALLERGVARVYAVDAGHGQLLGSLRQDARVVNLEAINLGALTTELVPDAIDIVTIDVSYLSLAAAVPQLDRVHLSPDATLIALVKPMFELHLGELPEEHRVVDAVARAVAGVEAAGWRVIESLPSPVTGARGAIEAFLHATRGLST
jgi:23S rRNA (cytidine1920-2'-O)/16S rRNA (cytidine1409-2'-O)-methyltransferase